MLMGLSANRQMSLRTTEDSVHNELSASDCKWSRDMSKLTLWWVADGLECCVCQDTIDSCL
jgi:hypothetical protein